jgi:hypothetical protein
VLVSALALVATALATSPVPGQPALDALRVEAQATALLLPQNESARLGAARTVVFDDERIEVEAIVRAGSAATLASVGSVVVQRRAAGSTDFTDVAPLREAVSRPARPEVGRPERTVPPVNKVPPPVATTYSAERLILPANTEAIRVAARQRNGALAASPSIALHVRKAPRVLTLLAMGGACTDPDANTHFRDLTDARIMRDEAVCAQKSVPATFLGDLTPMPSVNCNNMCNSGCTNFMEHFGNRLVEMNLANELQGINNPGTDLCVRRTNPNGIANRIVVGKWRNTEEEPVCGTPLTFNKLIDELRVAGNGHVILIGQSQGGAKFAGMVREHWRWADAVTVDLFVSWDASSFTGVPTFVSNTPCRGSVLGEPCTSMGTRSVGSRPKKLLHFFQYHDPIPFQNGAPMQEGGAQHDLNVCFSHNAIARSQFVHRTTADAVAAALRSLRDAERH